jgi:hypothetical protein
LILLRRGLIDGPPTFVSPPQRSYLSFISHEGFASTKSGVEEAIVPTDAAFDHTNRTLARS